MRKRSGCSNEGNFFMASKGQFTQIKNRIFASILLSFLFCTFAFPVRAYAKDIPIPDLITFIETVKDGNPSSLRGVYVRDVMALSIVQQPAGSPGFVSADEFV